MPLRNDDCNKFTLLETRERIKQVKYYLSSKERVDFLIPERFTYVKIPGYDSLDEYSFVQSPELTERIMRQHVRDNRDSFAGVFSNYSVFHYPKEHSQLQKILCVFGMRFYKYKSTETTKSVVACLGSKHHAPRILWRDHSNNRVIFEKLPHYLDLF